MRRVTFLCILLGLTLVSSSIRADQKPASLFKIYVFTAAELSGGAKNDKSLKEMIDSTNDVRKAIREKHKDWFVLVTNRSDAEIILEIKRRYPSVEYGNVVEGQIYAFDGFDHLILGQGGLQGQVFNVWSTAAKDMADRLEKYFRDNYELLSGLRAIAPTPEASKAFKEGDELFKKKEYDAAIQSYNKALVMSPKFASAWNNRGMSYYKKGDLDSALSDFNEALKLNSKSSKSRYNRGMLWLDRKDYGNALDDFTAILLIDAKDADAQFGRAFALAKQGNCEEAIVGYTEALALEPAMAQAAFNRGLCNLKLGETNASRLYRAIDDFTASWNANKLDGESLLYRGQAQLGLNMPERALEDFNQALGLFAPQQRTYFFRGNACMQLKRYNDALYDYTHAIELDPLDASAYFNRSLAYQATGLKKEAAADKKKAIALDPSLAKNQD